MLFATATMAATACNALTGVSDLHADLCEDCELDARVDEGVADAPPSDHEMAPSDAAADTFDGPAFCVGLVLYAGYDEDGGSTSVVGPSLLNGTKDSVVSGGKFGMGLQVNGTDGTAFYPMGGSAVYPDQAGTVALWFKSSNNQYLPVERTFVKPTVDMTTSMTNESAPSLRYDADASVLGLSNQQKQGNFITAGVGDLLAALGNSPYVHLVGTWNEAQGTLRFWLNGGSTTDTFAESKTSWTPQQGPTQYLRLSSSAYPANGIFDELAVWSRELETTEIQALYASPVPIKDACGF